MKPDKALEILFTQEKKKVKRMATTSLLDIVKSQRITTQDITNILLLSSERSGGEFLGQLLTKIFPDIFYTLDPLLMVANNEVRPITHL